MKIESYDNVIKWSYKLAKTWVQENLKDWQLIKHLPNPYPYHGDHRKGSLADFYIYQKI